MKFEVFFALACLGVVGAAGWALFWIIRWLGRQSFKLTVHGLYRNYQRRDAHCSFCNVRWRDGGPFCEGHHGSKICGSCAKRCLGLIAAEVVRLRQPQATVVAGDGATPVDFPEGIS